MRFRIRNIAEEQLMPSLTAAPGAATPALAVPGLMTPGSPGTTAVAPSGTVSVFSLGMTLSGARWYAFLMPSGR